MPQKAFLFGGTIASNLRFGDQEATDEDLWRALDIAQGREFVEQMEKVWTARSPKAAPTSRAASASGSRSRGRSSSNPTSTSSTTASRPSTSGPTRACAPRWTGSCGHATVIIVAQRVGTILRADRIVVLDNGGIVGVGTHDELMKTCETYREIVLSQVTEEEVA